MTKSQQIPWEPRRLLLSFAMAAGMVTAMAGLRYLLDPILGQTSPYILFILPPLFLANRSGWIPGFVALVLGMLVGNFFFAAPRMSFWVEGPENQLGLLIYLCVGGAGIYLADARTVAAVRRVEEIRARLAAIVETSEDAIISKTLEGVIRTWNAGAERLFGYTPEEAVGRPVTLVIPPELQDEERLILERLRRGERVEHFETIRVAKGGRRIEVSLTVSPLRDSKGQVMGASKVARDITERKRAEQALRSSEERLRLFLDSVPAPIAMLDRDMRYLFHSRRWLTDYHLAERNLTGLNHYEVFPEVTEIWKAIHRECLAGAIRRGDEDRFERADGSVQWVHWEVRPWKQSDGTLGGIIIFSEDITDRKCAEDKVRTSEERYRQLFEANPHPMWVFDTETLRFLAVNDAAVFRYGFSRDEFLRMTIADIRPAEDLPNLMGTVKSPMPPLLPGHEWRHRWKDGTIRDVEVASHAIPFGDRPARLVLATDVTERKQTEDRLRKVQQRLAHVVTSSPAVLFTLAIENDRIGGITWISDNLQTMLGYATAVANGRGWWPDNVHPEDRDTIAVQTAKQLFGQGHATHEYRFRRADGVYRWTQGELRLVRDDQGRPVEAVGSWSDITERKQLENQFHQAQKMDAVGQLAGGIAHDFNNLLTIITGYSEFMLLSLSQTDPLRSSVAAIKDAGERAAGLTSQLLAFSRRSVLEPRVLDPNTVVTDTGKMLIRLLGEDIVLKSFLDPRVGRIKVDPGQFGQVLMNLAVNARDAMPTGGQLTIETHSVVMDETAVLAGPHRRPGRYAMIAVSDNGCGMSDDVKARAFEPFFTTKGEGKGTGLGLATVFGIVKQSGGYVEVYSEVGVGTTFKVYLPVVEEVETPAIMPDSAKIRGGLETVLLVEDQAEVRRLAVIALQAHGYSIIAAGDGQDALQQVERDSPHLDLLVTDVVMPGMNGRQLAEALRSRYPGMKVLYISGYTNDAVVRHGILQADVAFLHKPFTPFSLARKVREVLDQT